METIKEMANRLVDKAQTQQVSNFYEFLYQVIETSPYSLHDLIVGLNAIKENNERDLKEFEKSVDETPEIIKPKTKD